MSGKVAKVFKNACFPQFLGFCGVAYSCLFGFGRFGCFCVSCFAFLFGVDFVSVCLLCVVLWLDVVVPVSVFLFVLFVCLFVCLFFCLFVFLSFGGFKGQVRWPKGPPHLALNPPCFCFFLFFCLFFFSVVFCLFFWRV